MRFLFVGGCERSGTTLIQQALCAHSRIAGGPEFVFTSRIADLFDAMRAKYPEEFAVRLAAYYDEAKLHRAFRNLLTGFFEALAERCPQAVYVSEKTPSNIGAVKTLLELFPDARFVHVVRDGRDVVASHRDVAQRLRARGRLDTRSLGTRVVCARWNRAVDAHFKLQAEPALFARYHLVHYERLVREPEPVLAELFDFLELDPEPATLDPPGASGLGVDGIWVTREQTGRGFDPGAIDRWRRDLPAVPRLFASVLIGANLRRLGYPVGAVWVVVSKLLARLRLRGRGSKRDERALLVAGPR